MPPPAQLRRIIEAGGGAVLEQGAPLREGAIAVVPDGADASHPFAQEARLFPSRPPDTLPKGPPHPSPG